MSLRLNNQIFLWKKTESNYGKIDIEIPRKSKIHDTQIEKIEKYKLFDVTKFISVLPMFRLIQQSLTRTRC